ncbi:CCA tRNA nucleotidyltransferase, mitochondrial, partial [Ascosphaera atra]
FLAYTTFLETLERLSLIDIHLLKPIVNGHELAAALGVSPGFWMAKALAEVVNWQLRNPETTDKEKAIEEVRAKREVIGWDAAPPAGEKKGKGKGKKA